MDLSKRDLALEMYLLLLLLLCSAFAFSSLLFDNTVTVLCSQDVRKAQADSKCSSDARCSPKCSEFAVGLHL